MTAWRLVADVGGSNVRFSRGKAGRKLVDKRSFPLRDFASFYEALDAYIAQTGGVTGCCGAAIGVAGPVDDNMVRLTNADWTISGAEVSVVLGGVPVGIVNDLEAVAVALPHLEESDLTPIGPSLRPSIRKRTMIAVNVGTGFGAATILPTKAGWFPHPGEPGHMTLGAQNADELEILAGISTVEELLSGYGVQRLYQRIAEKMGEPVQEVHCASDIFSRVNESPAAASTLRQFSLFLGRVSGDLAISTNAWGGVFLCGSVVKGWLDAGGAQYFRKPFEEKGPMSTRMQDIFSGLISCDDVALIGLNYLNI